MDSLLNKLHNGGMCDSVHAPDMANRSSSRERGSRIATTETDASSSCAVPGILGHVILLFPVATHPTAFPNCARAKNGSAAYPPLKAPTGFLTGNAPVGVSINLAVVWKLRKGVRSVSELATLRVTSAGARERRREAIVEGSSSVRFNAEAEAVVELPAFKSQVELLCEVCLSLGVLVAGGAVRSLDVGCCGALGGGSGVIAGARGLSSTAAFYLLCNASSPYSLIDCFYLGVYLLKQEHNPIAKVTRVNANGPEESVSKVTPAVPVPKPWGIIKSRSQTERH